MRNENWATQNKTQRTKETKKTKSEKIAIHF